ncbi:MAG: Gldg family protein [Planctomycetaceae bacterium]|nr:Gldg family protein [Planctomycetaceae bacterium]
MNTKVLFAVFRRNFVSYFANPTGYVFICLFVLLGATAAFWVPDFFSNNLANLDQLSYWFPFIMLVYIPTITMGVWADERRQGTDELLLTIPARDFDIVLGKYLAAVAIFSVALVFSFVCNLAVLSWLGSPDVGLFIGTYIGYWLVGLAMLAIGVVASFLTGNITIAYVVAVLFNVPLVFLTAADAIFGALGRQGVLAIKTWSISQQFADFGRGVLSLAGLVYFVMIVVVMLYLSMILIGRRHWYSGARRWALAGHYTTRTLALGLIAIGSVVVFRHHDVRWDVTSEKLGSLSPETRKLVQDLKTDRPVRIEAFISPSVPEAYVPARMNLLSVLQELKAIGGANLQVMIHDTDRFTEESALAEKKYSIEPREVTTFSHGALSTDHIFLHVAVKYGSGKALVAFVDQDTPVEYELVRSICILSQQKRKKLGVLTTDAQLYGGFSMSGMTPNWPIIDELEKQYEVVRVDPTKPITDKYDVLLAVQPSSLGPTEMGNFVAAVRGGQPTAIFEDPAPMWAPNVPATSAPRQPPGGMNPMFAGGQQQPKGDITQLWNLLGVDVAGDQVIWQDYNPYPKLPLFSENPEFVFVNHDGGGAKEPFGRNRISSGLQQMLFPFPGAVGKLNASTLEFTPLVKTGEKTGTVRFAEVLQMSPMGPRGLNPDRQRTATDLSYVLAAQIQGKVKLASEDDAEKPEAVTKDKKKAPSKKPTESNVNVVLVCDIDMLSQIFFKLREQAEIPELGIRLKFDNVAFILNALDSLAGDTRFLEIRKRRPKYRTLSHIDQWTEKDRKNAADQIEKFSKNVEEEQAKAQKAMDEEIAELRKRKNVDQQQMAIELIMKQQDLERQAQTRIAQLRQEQNKERTKIETGLALKIRRVQEMAKLLAVLLPPIPPLLVAVVVFFTRRTREREGVARARLR